MEYLIKLAANPLAWVAMLVSIVLFQHAQVKSIKTELNSQRAVAERIETNMVTTANFQESFNKLMREKSDLRVRQAAISSKIDSIPDTSTCKPFQDINLQEAATQLRQYQVEALDETQK